MLPSITAVAGCPVAALDAVTLTPASLARFAVPTLLACTVTLSLEDVPE